MAGPPRLPAASRRLWAMSQHLDTTGTSGIISTATQPPSADLHDDQFAADLDGEQRAAALEHVHREGYAVLTNAVPPSELRALTDWVAASQSANPSAWPADARDGQRLYSQPLLESGAAAALLGTFLRPPRTFGLIDELLGGEACFAQLDLRDVPATTQRSTKDHLHHDTGAASTSDPEVIAARRFGQHDTLCQVTYLSDVGPDSAAFAVCPTSHRIPVRRPDQLSSRGGSTVSGAGLPIAGWQRWWEELQVNEAGAAGGAAAVHRSVWSLKSTISCMQFISWAYYGAEIGVFRQGGSTGRHRCALRCIPVPRQGRRPLWRRPAPDAPPVLRPALEPA